MELIKMNSDEVFYAIDGADDNDLITISVVGERLEYTKEHYEFEEADEEENTIYFIEKNGKSIDIINTNSINVIKVKAPRKSVDLISPRTKQGEKTDSIKDQTQN